jgi:transcriptional regulator with XRE-family HTH domain
MRLQQLRHAAGLSLDQVANALGITPNSVSLWESGHTSPAQRFHTPLANLYGVESVPLPALVARKYSAQGIAGRRRSTGLTQRELAHAIGVSAAAIGGWERRRHRPGLAAIDRLASVLGISKDEITADIQAVSVRRAVIDGARLRAMREGRGWTRAQLASRLGVQVSTVWRWETERRCPHQAIWERLTTVLGVQATELALPTNMSPVPDGD